MFPIGGTVLNRNLAHIALKRLKEVSRIRQLSAKPEKLNKYAPAAAVFLPSGEEIVYHNKPMVLSCRKKCSRELQGGSMEKNDSSDKSYQELFAELTKYERSGVPLQIDGFPASPLQIVSAHMVREESVYMRDYILDEHGVIQELDFCRIDVKKNKENA